MCKEQQLRRHGWAHAYLHATRVKLKKRSEVCMNEATVAYRQRISTGVGPKRLGLPQESRLCALERESQEATPARQPRGLNWDMFAIWSLVVFSFAALAFATYVIWAKIHADSPF